MWFPPVPKFLQVRKLKDNYTISIVRLITQHNISLSEIRDMKLSTFLALIKLINKDNNKEGK